MAYEKSGSWFNYFSPDDFTAVGGVLDIGAASADAGEAVCVKPCTIKRVMFVVTDEAVVGTSTAPTVVFTKRPTPNSSTSEAVVATLTIPDGTAVGAVIYADVDTSAAAAQFDVGDSLELSHTVGVGGSVAGQGIPAAICFDRNEDPANNSDMTASA